MSLTISIVRVVPVLRGGSDAGRNESVDNA